MDEQTVPTLSRHLRLPSRRRSRRRRNGSPLRDLEDGQRVRGVYAVRERELRRKRNGEPWLRLLGRRRQRHRRGGLLGGRRGALRARRHRHRRLRHRRLRGQRALGGEDQDRRAARGRAARVRGRRPGAGVATSRFEQLETDLRALLATVQDPQLRDLLDRFFGEGSETWARFRDAPAAKVYHQAYRHGLLEHTLSVAQAVSAAANFFPGIDRDVAVTGALLHDIGKTEAYNDDPLAIDLTDARPPAGRDPARLLPGAPPDRGHPRLRPRPGPGASSTSSSATTARSSTAPRSSPPPARPSSST